jgi:hypothetical protein
MTVRFAVVQGRDGEGNTVTVRVPVEVGAANTVTVPTAFADGTNRTADLQAFLNSVPDGSTIDFGNRPIRTDQTLTLYLRRGLTFVRPNLYTDDLTGNGLTIAQLAALPDGTPAKNAARERSFWLIQDCDDITFQGARNRGPNVAAWALQSPSNPWPETAYIVQLEAQHAYDVQFSRHVSIVDDESSHLYGDAYFFGPNHSDGRWCEDVEVIRPHAHHIGRQGAALTGVRRIKFVDIWWHDLRRSAFDLEPERDFGGSDDVTIEGGRVGKWADATGPAFWGQKFNWLAITNRSRTRRLTVRDHTARAMTVQAGAVGRCENLVFERCKSLEGTGNPNRAAWTFARVDGLRVAQCEVPLQPGLQTTPPLPPYQMAMVGATDCTGIDVLGNGNKFGTVWTGTEWIDKAGSGVVELRVS